MHQYTTHLCGLKAHKAAGSGCYPTTVAGNSNDANRIRTRLHEREIRKHDKENINIEMYQRTIYTCNDHEELSEDHTFIPIIGTQLTAVPVALERNSARASSAIARRLA